jgi:hypothetical protein
MNMWKLQNVDWRIACVFVELKRVKGNQMEYVCIKISYLIMA